MKRTLFLVIFTALIGVTACTKQSYTAYRSENVLIDTAYNSPELEWLIAGYREDVSAKMNKVIGKADTTLNKYSPESPLGNFAADAVFHKGFTFRPKGFERMGKDNTISLVNFGGLRATLEEGRITVGNVFELMPFDNTIMLVKIDPEGLRQLLDYLLGINGQPVSNAQFRLSDSKKELFVNGKLFDQNQELYVITSNYLASGGDKMNFLKNATQKWDSGYLIRDAFIDYITSHESVSNFKPEGRMIINR